MTSQPASIAPDQGLSALPQLWVRNLTKTFGKVEAVRSISFEVGAGRIAALLGGNGAGKTTTIAMLMGLTQPTAGEISILGVDMVRNRHAALGRMNFESPYVDMPMRLTVRQNLTVFAGLYGIGDVKGRIGELSALLQLEALLDRKLGSLSAGQKTRASLAKALINRPSVLLLDEPTASLDPDTADWVRGMLRDYVTREGATILLASHNMAEVERLCDEVIMMKAGEIVARGTPGELIDRYGRRTMEEVFLAVARSGQHL